MLYKLENYTQSQLFMTYLKRHAKNDLFYHCFKDYLKTRPNFDKFTKKCDKLIFINVGSFISYMQKNYKIFPVGFEFHDILFNDYYKNFLLKRTNAKEYPNILRNINDAIKY